MSQCYSSPLVRIEKIRENHTSEITKKTETGNIKSHTLRASKAQNKALPHDTKISSKSKYWGLSNGTVVLPYEDMHELIPADQYEYAENASPPYDPISTPNPSVPSIFPNQPTIKVPANPLVPAEYQEYIDYSSIQYLNGFLRTQIGKFIEVEMLIGSNQVDYKEGFLVGVGINYLLLQNIRTEKITAVDFYNIKSVEIYTGASPLATEN